MVEQTGHMAWIRDRIIPFLLCLLLMDLLISFCSDTSARMRDSHHNTSAVADTVEFIEDSMMELFVPMTVYPGDPVRIWVRGDSAVTRGWFGTEWSEPVDLEQDPETDLFYGDFDVPGDAICEMSEIEVFLVYEGGDEFGEIAWIRVVEPNTAID